MQIDILAMKIAMMKSQMSGSKNKRRKSLFFFSFPSSEWPTHDFNVAAVVGDRHIVVLVCSVLAVVVADIDLVVHAIHNGHAAVFAGPGQAVTRADGDGHLGVEVEGADSRGGSVGRLLCDGEVDGVGKLDHHGDDGIVVELRC